MHRLQKERQIRHLGHVTYQSSWHLVSLPATPCGLKVEQEGMSLI